MATIMVKQHDTAPWTFRLTLGADSYVDLAGADVALNMKPVSPGIGSVIQRAPVEVTQTVFEVDGGSVAYLPTTDDVDAAGVHVAEFKVQFADGTERTFPEREYLNVVIQSDLDG